jgi:hypothetical protein
LSIKYSEKFDHDFTTILLKGWCEIVERTIQNDQTIVRYLLNELSSEDQERFEADFLEDEVLFEQVRAVEEELIEDYVKGELSGRERQLFERHYLASEQRRARVNAARHLIQVCSSQSSVSADIAAQSRRDYFFLRTWLHAFLKQPLALGFGTAAALLLLIGLGLAIELTRLRGQATIASEERVVLARRNEEFERQLADRDQQLERERQKNADLQKKLGEVNSRTVQPVSVPVLSQTSNDQVVYLALAPGIRDLNKPDRAIISSENKFVELRITLERQEKPATYRAVVKTIEGNREIWSENGLKLRQTRAAQYLVLRVPADRFSAVKAQYFVLTVLGSVARGKSYEEIESYPFEVVIK